MKKLIINIFAVLGGAFMLTTNARADGEDKVEPGTQWVDPVAFYSLMDITTSDLQRAYDQGDIDFNKVMKKKGVKVFGLKLKPVAIAAHIDGEKPIGEHVDWIETQAYEYKEIMGIKGAPISDAAFCVYADESVNRNFTSTYNITKHIHYTTNGDILTDDNWKDEVKLEIQISGLCIVPTEEGLGFSYAMTAKERERTIYNLNDGRPIDDHFGSSSWNCSKAAGVSPVLGHFIYYQGSQHLLVMLSADLVDVYNEAKGSLGDRYKVPDGHQMEMIKRPWPRVYFEVTEMLVGYEGGEPVIDEETRRELRNTMDGLLAWLSGEGDPLGLGEHTDAKMSAVINSLSTIAAILMTNGLVSIAGGGSGLVGTLTSGITGAGGTPPPTPDTSQIDGLEPKRKEDEDEDNTPPPPPDPNADLFKQYVKTDADGDLTFTDPVTGKETIYINNGDGTFTNLNTGQSWTREEIGDRLRYETENQALLKQDADQAARNAAEQRAQWDAQNQRDLERGYSDEQKAYADWKQEQENQQKHQEYLEKMAAKYHVPPTDKAVKDAIKFEQVMNEIDAKTHLAEAEAIGESINYLEKVDKGCEVAVNVMSGAVPGGSTVKNVYTFAKSTLVATSEAVADGKSFGEGLAHIAVGMGDGALGVIQNEAEGLAGKGKYAWAKELGINVATEDLKAGMKAIAEGKSIDEIGKTLINTTGSKTAEFGVGKLISGSLGALGKRASDSLDATKVPTLSDHNKVIFDTSSARTLDKWLNKTHEFNVGPQVSTFNVNVGNSGVSIAKGVGAGLFSGQLNTGALTEGIIGETVSNTLGYDWGGDVAEWANDKAVAGAANVMYGADKTVEFFKNIGKFSDAAAAYKK